jgi:plastocyanin
MGGKGFLGTNASWLADLTLVLSLLVALILTVGVVMALRKRYNAHRWLQTAAVALNAVLVLVVMVGSFLRSVTPGIPLQVEQPYYYAAIIHGFVGVFAFVFGSYVALRGNELMPKALKFSAYKPYMRIAYSLYMLATGLGVWVYLTWYAGPVVSADPQAQPLAQAANEVVIPMANFVFNPVDITVPVGATVIWLNRDAAPHNAVADDGTTFRSEVFGTGQEFRFTFNTAGVFPYYCELHGSPGGIDMAGTIRVVPADQAPLLSVAPAPIGAAPAQPTPLPLPALPIGQPIGTAAFRDDQARNDQIILQIGLGAAPPAGQAFVAFLTTPDGSAAQPLGPLQIDGSGTAQLTFSAPSSENLLARYSRLVITQEPAGSAAATPGGAPLFESTLPAQALQSIRQLLVSGANLPTQQGYTTGLRAQSEELERHAQFLAQAQAAGDLAGVKRHAEHIYNLVSGSLDPQFGDLNGDGRSQNPGDGFGLLENGGQIGYLNATSGAAVAAASAPDATNAIKVHAEHVRISAENMRSWATEIRTLALQLSQAVDTASIAPQTTQLVTLSQQVSRGSDANGDGRIDPVPGEGGGLVAYEHAQYMAGFGLVPATR